MQSEELNVCLGVPALYSEASYQPVVSLSASRVKYEDPQATKGLAGALDARQQNTGAVSVHSFCCITRNGSDLLVHQGSKRAVCLEKVK